MNLSRRSFVKSSAAALAGAGIPTRSIAPWALQAPSSSSVVAAPSGPPVMVVEDFSRVFDPAYLSNGLIGIRPGPNPLAQARAFVSGFVFSDVPHEVEAISPAPYPLGTDIRVREASLLKHPDLLKIQRQQLDMTNGELVTEAVFAPGAGDTLKVRILQFASRTVPSLVCQEIQVVASGTSEIEFVPFLSNDGVPGRVYTTEPPPRTQIDLVSGYQSRGNLSKLGIALSIFTPDAPAQKQNAVLDEAGLSRTYTVRAEAGRAVRFRTIAAMVSTLYHPEPDLEAIRLSSWGSTIGFDDLQKANREAWSDLWQSRVQVTGDTEAQRVLDAAFFYLHSSLHHSTRTGMPPFGLSQFAHYYGHSFWDTETWSLLPVTLATPLTARSLLEYRVRSLDYAQRQASLYGYRGAQFPWEAAPTNGFETTPTFAGTGWGEQHVTPDVALGFWEYQLATNDLTFLQEGTWPVLRAVADWIESRGVLSTRGFEIRHIMGPDEGVPNVDNQSYMNLACKMVLTAAIRCAQMAGASAPASWTKIRDAIVLPVDKNRGIMLPYDNPPSVSSKSYSTGLMDFLTVHDPPLESDLVRKTHELEQTALREHSTGALMPTSDEPIGFAEAAVAATAAFLGDRQRAAQLFDLSWRKAWLPPFGMIREVSSQDYGCFLTNYGSLLQTVMLGFTGIRIREGDWRKYPASLPAGWTRVEVDRIWVRGEPKHLVATDGASAKLLS